MTLLAITRSSSHFLRIMPHKCAYPINQKQ
ncbi:Uncharacterised protein [Vibrio cholerae]|nr:Uncharacterised protein [Vibrio cholerae]